MYTDALSGDICNLTTIPVLNCVHRMCQHVFEVAFSKCARSSNINITVFGTNLLGNGTMSNTVTIGKFSIMKFLEKLNVFFQSFSTKNSKSNSVCLLWMLSVRFSPPKQAKRSVVLYMGLETTIVTVQTHHWLWEVKTEILTILVYLPWQLCYQSFLNIARYKINSVSSSLLVMK